MTWEEPIVGTYTGRYIIDLTTTEIYGNVVKYQEDNGSSGSFPVPEEFVPKVKVGHYYALELHRGSTVAGVGIRDSNGWIDWIFRHDDWTLWAKWKVEVDEAAAKMRTFVDENLEDWKERLDKLPSPLKEELEIEITKDDFVYGYMGFGYCLVIAELAVLYKASGGVDSDEVNEYARKIGTSGNQHGMAKAIAEQKL